MCVCVVCVCVCVCVCVFEFLCDLMEQHVISECVLYPVTDTSTHHRVGKFCDAVPRERLLSHMQTNEPYSVVTT